MKQRLLFFIIIMSNTVFAGDINIQKIQSLQSLYIEVYRENILVGKATAFVIKSKTKYYLVTNYHVFTNRNAWNNEWCDTSCEKAPDRVAIYYHDHQFKPILKFEKLLDGKGNNLWIQHVINRQMVDVVELPITDTVGVEFTPVNYSENLVSDVIIHPSDLIYVVGYPDGIRAENNLPLWKAGIISSEPEFDQNNLPIVWVDLIGYHGMSGSPVFYTAASIETKHGMNIGMGMGAQAPIFIGVFSHINIHNVYGALWKGSYLKNIFNDLP